MTQPIEPVPYFTGSIRLTQYVEHTDRTQTRRDELVSIDLRGHSVPELLDALLAQIAVLQIRAAPVVDVHSGGAV